MGFDLDMTLIDTRPGFAATLAVLAEETGVDLDVEELSSRLGPPLDQLLAPHYPAERLPGLVAVASARTTPTTRSRRRRPSPARTRRWTP